MCALVPPPLLRHRRLPLPHSLPTLAASPLLLAPGSMGGVVEACCLQPIDVIKTRLQLDRAGKYHGETAGCCL